MNARQLLIFSLILSVLALARVAEAVSAFLQNPANGALSSQGATPLLLWSQAGVALLMFLGAALSWHAWTRQRYREPDAS